MIRVVDVHGLHSPAERGGVVYVGRAARGWPASRWANPFRAYPGVNPTTAYRTWVLTRPPGVLDRALAELWEATGRGEKPLGCWCVSAAAGDGYPLVCHAQVLADLLRERYGAGTSGRATAAARRTE